MPFSRSISVPISVTNSVTVSERLVRMMDEDVMEIDQAPGNQEQNPCHRRRRQIGSQRRDQQQDEHQQDRGIHRGHRRPCACRVVHAAAVERAAGGIAGKETADQIRQALPDEFLIAVDALLGFHRDGARDGDRLGQRQHGDHQCREQHLMDGLVGKIGDDEGWQMRGQRAHGLDQCGFHADLQIDQISDHATHHHGHDHVRQLGNVALGQNTHGQRDRTDKRDPGIDVADLRDCLFDHHMEGCAARDVDTEEILHLTGRDEQRGTGREADDHRVRDEVDQHSHAREPEDQLEQSGEEGEREHHADELRRTGFGEGTDGGEHRDGDGRGRSGDQMPARPEQGGDDRRQHGGIQTVFRRHPGDGGESHALRQHDQRTGDAGDQVGTGGAAIHHVPPLHER